MAICLFCKKITTNPKFYNNSCAASYNNSLFPKRLKKQHTCIDCGANVKSVNKRCSTCADLRTSELRNAWIKELEPLIALGWSSRKIASTIGIAQTTVMNRLNKCNLKIKHLNGNPEFHCYYCNKYLINNQTHFCSKEHKELYYKTNYYKDKYQKGKDLRNDLITQYGGSCTKCGYNKNTAALVFHHVDADKKLFGVNAQKCTFKTVEELQQEASKCILLCTNCHAELHYPSYNV